MPRKATGQIIAPDGKQRSWAIRFTAYGKRRFVTLGRPEEGWDRQRAEAELRHVLADIERGIWRPAEQAPAPEIREEPTFHVFASEWFERHRPEWRENTVNDYRWALTHHLIPFFTAHRLAEITVAEVDRFKAAKLAEGKIGPSQINKCLTRLAQILEEAIEYELISGRNPARGRRRRVKGTRPARTWVEPEQLLTLLESSTGTLRPIVAVLAGCGLRVGEATARDWPDISIPTATIAIGRAKTDAGVRHVDIPLGALEELIEWRARRPAYRGHGDPVFVTGASNCAPRRQTRRNVEHRLKVAIRAANKRLEELRIEPISDRVTPHSLRRTYASVRAACGDDPVYIAEQLGHTDMNLTFRIYQRAVKRRSKLSGGHLREFDRALEWAEIGSGEGVRPPSRDPVPPKMPANDG